MEPRRILKALANGWQAPYPDEVVYKDMLLLKDYRLNDFPKDAESKFIDDGSYVEWLQDYLFRCTINLTDEQIKISNHIATDKYFGGAFLGGEAGFYESVHALYPAYNYPDDFEETLNIENLTGIVYADPYAEFLTVCEDDIDEPKPSRLEFILQDYGHLLLMKIEEAEFLQYWPGFVKLEPLHSMFDLYEGNLELADSPWRVYLSLILKRIPSKSDRINELNRFFDEYADAIHK
jgi:hypothetical protein